MIGKRFGRLVVIKQEDYTKNKTVKWLCKCDCGNEKIIDGSSLRRGLTKSCDCLLREHGYKSGKLSKKYNTYDLSSEFGIGYTFKGEKFYFDIEDYDKIKDRCWHMIKGYATSKINLKGNKTQIIQMHRLIMNVTDKSIEIDHISHNTYDNRKCQLRIVTHSQNGMNKDKQSNNTSGIKGVHFDKRTSRWVASIMCNRRYIFLGRYINITDADKARKEAEEKYFGKYNYKSIKTEGLT